MSAAPPSLTAHATSAQPERVGPLRPEDRVTFNEHWLQAARPILEHLAASQVPFTSDDLRDIQRFGLGDPPHPNHLGALFSAASKAGLIRHVGYVASRTKSRHSSVIGLWRGVPDRLESLKVSRAPGGAS